MDRRTDCSPANRHEPRARRLALAAVVAIFGVACAATPELPLLPPVAVEPTQAVRPGKFVWGDLISQDTPASKAFYSALFGWTFSDNGRYSTVLNHGVPIAGIVAARDEDRGTEWVGNLSVVDVDRAAKVFDERGGHLESGPFDAPNRGRIALVSHSDGAVLLLVRATGGDPPDTDPVIGGWLWWELWTHDVEGAMDLLAAACGYHHETVDFRDDTYRVLRDSKVRRAGIIDAPPKVRPTWLPYFRVADTTASVEQAVALGARLVAQNERTAILVDPNHAEFAIGTWAKETDRIMKEAK